MLSFKEQQAESFITEEWNSAAIDVAADYFLDEGINEEGIDLIVEEVGLEDFVEYILDPPSEDLMEERSAKRAAASAPSYEKVKAKVDSGDAARKKAGKGEYAKTAAAKRNYGDEDNTNYDDKPAAKKKTVAKAKTAPKPKAKPKVVEIKKKVEKSVPKAKAAQPAKKATKKGLLSKIGDTVKKGVERHQKAVSDTKAAYKKQRAKGKVPEKRAKEFAAGVKSGVKTAVKFAKDVKKTVSEEAYDHYKDATLERRRVQSYKDSKPSTGATARKDDKEKSRKAFQNVVKNLKARYGDDSVLTNKTNESVDLQEISADTLSAASRAADKDRGKKAVAGDREGAAKRVKQASKFYKAASEKRKLEKEEYEVTNADKKGNTPAYQAYKAGKKNAKTGKPLYKAADHMKEGAATAEAAKKEAVLKSKEDKKVAEKKALRKESECKEGHGYWDYHEKEGLKRFTDFIQEGNPTTRMMSKSSSQQTGNISADRGSDVKKNRESRKGLEKDLKKKGIGYKKGTGEYKYDDGSKGREVSYQTSPAKGMSKRKFGKVMRRLGRKHGQESVITKDKNKPARLHDTESKKPGKSVNIGKTKPGKHPDGSGETSGTKVRSNKLSKKTNKPSYHYG